MHEQILPLLNLQKGLMLQQQERKQQTASSKKGVASWDIPVRPQQAHHVQGRSNQVDAADMQQKTKMAVWAIDYSLTSLSVHCEAVAASLGLSVLGTHHFFTSKRDLEPE